MFHVVYGRSVLVILQSVDDPNLMTLVNGGRAAFPTAGPAAVAFTKPERITDNLKTK